MCSLCLVFYAIAFSYSCKQNLDEIEIVFAVGHGFLESVYEKAFEFALNSKGVTARRKIEVPVWFRGQQVGDFSADMLVQECVLLELKACRALDTAHEAQLLNYLRATEIEVGLLFNFGLKPQFKRLAFDNRRKQTGGRPESIMKALLSDAEEVKKAGTDLN